MVIVVTAVTVTAAVAAAAATKLIQTGLVIKFRRLNIEILELLTIK